MTDKKDLSERDICTKFVMPALEQAGWDMQRQVREEVSFTDGRIYVKGNLSVRGKCKRADFILYYKPNIPVAVIEVKDNKHAVMAGIQQGLDYAVILDIPTVFSSNGDGFYEHDRTAADDTVEREIQLHEFPTPEQLWERYKHYKGITTPEAERISAQDYFFDGTGRSPRYYQQIAINRTVEAIANGQQRILLTMATGTGKTYTAFQIIHRLWKAGVKKRILFLADRNALIDQTRRGDFRHFKDKMTVIKHKKILVFKTPPHPTELVEQGHKADRKHVRRLMRLMGIQAIHPGPKTSKPHPQHKVYPYLLRNLEINRANQVWCSDVTYLPMASGFLYLTVIMDWYSRKVLSWRVSNSLDASFCVDALEEAIYRYGTPGIFNTDQGSQYTSEAFTEVLENHGIKISMDGKGAWKDNVFVERLWRSVKYEEVYLNAYESASEAKQSLAKYFHFYNENRKHQTLMATPDQVYYESVRLQDAG